MPNEPIVKYGVEVWDPERPRYEDAHEKHRLAGTNCGSVRAVGRLFRREYLKQSSVNRAIPNLRRRFPNAVIETRTYEYEGFFWMQRGEMDTQ
jgi:hypothetical protein